MPALTVIASTPVRDVLQLLHTRRVGCVLVVEQDKLVGIFTERDVLLRLGADAAAYGDRPVSEFMTANPQTLEANARIAFAVQRMDIGGFRHVPVVTSDGAPLGVISVRDILDYLTEQMA